MRHAIPIDVIDNAMEKRIIWVPCGGAKNTNPPTPKGHIGEVRRENGDGVFELSDEWLKWEQALEIYQHNCFK